MIVGFTLAKVSIVFDSDAMAMPAAGLNKLIQVLLNLGRRRRCKKRRDFIAQLCIDWAKALHQRTQHKQVSC